MTVAIDCACDADSDSGLIVRQSSQIGNIISPPLSSQAAVASALSLCIANWQNDGQFSPCPDQLLVIAAKLGCFGCHRWPE